jgi:hypothetical protein
MAFNNKFDLKRFGLLLKQDWLINKKYLVLVLLFLVVYYFPINYWLFYDREDRFVRYNYEATHVYRSFSQFLFSGIIFVSMSGFSAFTNKLTVSNYLLTPGSALEKLLAPFFIRVVVLVTLVVGLFVLMIDINLAMLTSGKINSTTYFDANLMPRFQFQYLVSVNNQCSLWNWLVVLNLYSLATILMSYPFISKIKTAKPKTTRYFIITIFSLALGLIIIPGYMNNYNGDFNFSNILPKVYAVTTHFDNIDIFCLAILPIGAVTAFSIAYFNLKEREVQ